MVIYVTKKDIKNGVRSNIYSCPIALAATRTLGCKVTVGGKEIHIWESNRYKCYNLPRRAVLFVSKFDTRRTVVPFKFKLSNKFISKTVSGCDSGEP